jgi:hypothetical protein
MTKILTAILESIKLTNPLVTLAGAVLTGALAIFNFFNTIWGQLLAKLTAVTLPTAGAASVMSGFEFVNYVFPLTELFTFCSAFMTLYLICAAVRMIKSFLPTIS